MSTHTTNTTHAALTHLTSEATYCGPINIPATLGALTTLESEDHLLYATDLQALAAAMRRKAEELSDLADKADDYETVIDTYATTLADALTDLDAYEWADTGQEQAQADSRLRSNIRMIVRLAGPAETALANAKDLLTEHGHLI